MKKTIQERLRELADAIDAESEAAAVRGVIPEEAREVGRSGFEAAWRSLAAIDDCDLTMMVSRRSHWPRPVIQFAVCDGEKTVRSERLQDVISLFWAARAAAVRDGADGEAATVVAGDVFAALAAEGSAFAMEK